MYVDLAWQASLLDAGPPSADPDFTGLRHIELDRWSWVDHVPGWLHGSDDLFAQLLAVAPWRQRERWMYDKVVAEPRLTARWTDPEYDERTPALAGDDTELPEPLRELSTLLSTHYVKPLDRIGVNLYRDGHDSVAWHGDTMPAGLPDPVVCTVSLGEPRAFLMRPKQGRTARRFELGHGDLLVMGGGCQRTWEHAVPKRAKGGPRMSITIRESAVQPVEDSPSSSAISSDAGKGGQKVEPGVPCFGGPPAVCRVPGGSTAHSGGDPHSAA